MLRTAFNILKYRKSKWAENKNIFRGIFIVMFILWFSWFQMVFHDPVRINIPEWVRYIGISLFIIGVSLFILSHIKLKGFEDRGYLVTKGIYSKIRNPMYLSPALFGKVEVVLDVSWGILVTIFGGIIGGMMENDIEERDLGLNFKIVILILFILSAFLHVWFT